MTACQGPLMSALLPSGVDRLTDDGAQHEHHDSAHGGRQSPVSLLPFLAGARPKFLGDSTAERSNS